MAPRDRRSLGGDGSATHGPDYTPSDAALFERLADFSQVGSQVGSRGGAGIGAGADRPAGGIPAAPSSTAFEYTESDGRAFDRLMGQLGGGRGKGRPAGRGASAGAGYTESDNRLFDQLMSSESLNTAGAQGTQGGAKGGTKGRAEAQAPAESAVQYTRQDLDTFQKIMPDPSAADSHQSPERSGGPSRPDRDVGHIRIVEFDKERSRRKESERRGKMNIKVRYFD